MAINQSEKYDSLYYAVWNLYLEKELISQMSIFDAELFSNDKLIQLIYKISLKFSTRVFKEQKSFQFSHKKNQKRRKQLH
jgi:hypothetical protein